MKTPENSNLPDYSVYVPPVWERAAYYFVSCVVLFLVGLLFYKNALYASFCMVLSLLLEKNYIELRRDKRQRKLADAFKESLYSISGSVAAGRQMPSALADAEKQAVCGFGKDSDIAKELYLIVSAYEGSHSDVAELLYDFGKRSCIPEIAQFALSYKICKNTGGDLEKVCLKSANLLIDRLEFRKQVESIASQKKLDIVILTALPLLILFFLNITSASYLDLMYSTREGRLIMTVCLLMMVYALIWSINITKLNL